jgi:PKD repeat protein
MQDYVTVTGILYCASYGNTSQEWIAAIDINGQNNSSAGSPSGYEDFTGFNFNLDPGATYNIALVPGFTSTKFEYWRLWIDFNHDGDFTDAGEELFSASKKRNTVTGLITIPAGLDVTTRMRVSMSRSSLPSPCEIFSAGEVEDYTVTISYAPPPPEPPLADFIGNPTSLAPGESVLFTDLSTGNPTSYYWQFNGGAPGESFDPIPPPVFYSQEGSWDVILTVSNAEGQSTETKVAYISVSSNPPLSSYCEPANINNSSDGINVVTIGANTNNTSPGGPGYVFFTSPVFNFTPGQTYSVSLSPFNNSNRNFWRIWVDLNGDGDFEDGDETLFSANNKKGTVNGSMLIPSYAPGQTRMRITMRTGSSPAPCDDNFDGEVEDYNVVSLGEMEVQAEKPSILSVLLYPNPVAELLHVNISGNTGPVIITVFSAQGNKLYQEEIRDAISKIDMTGFFDGLYFIHVTDGEQKTIVKVVVNQ